MQHLKLKKIVLIGASTGGPGQIKKIIASLPPLEHTSVIIAQHMAEGFLESFVSTLSQNNINKVEITHNNKNLLANTIYVCEKSMVVQKDISNFIFKEQEHKVDSFNPDINRIFNSFVSLKELEILSVILTGIGDDGIEACTKLNNNGARCITETAQSAIIDGMPSRARELVPNIRAYTIDEIVKIICEFCE